MRGKLTKKRVISDPPIFYYVVKYLNNSLVVALADTPEKTAGTYTLLFANSSVGFLRDFDAAIILAVQTVVKTSFAFLKKLFQAPTEVTGTNVV